MTVKNKSEAILAVVIGVLALWPNLVGAVASKWVILVAAVLLLGDSMKCCGMLGKKEQANSKKKKR